MAWTVPRTWSAGEIVGGADMNTHIRDNLNAVKDPPFYHSAVTSAWTWGGAGDWTGVTSLSATIATYGGDVMVGFQALVSNSNGVIDLNVNTTAYAGTTRGLGRADSAGMLQYVVWVTGLASGTHTFQPIFSGGATLGGDLSPTLFWAREVS